MYNSNIAINASFAQWILKLVDTMGSNRWTLFATDSICYLCIDLTDFFFLVPIICIEILNIEYHKKEIQVIDKIKDCGIYECPNHFFSSSVRGNVNVVNKNKPQNIWLSFSDVVTVNVSFFSLVCFGFVLERNRFGFNQSHLISRVIDIERSLNRQLS